MEVTRLISSDDPLFRNFKEMYEVSFPIFEQRTDDQQEEAFLHSNYCLNCYFYESRLTGFIAYWEFDTYLYIEHLAIHPAERGKGLGKVMLDQLMSSHTKRLILEIDPVTDHVSARRLRFYQSLGFVENSHTHTHPAYRKGFAPHSLTVLSTQGLLPYSEYEVFNADLHNKVMNV